MSIYEWRTYLGVVEHEACGCVNGDGSCVGGGIWALASVELECVEFGFPEMSEPCYRNQYAC